MRLPTSARRRREGQHFSDTSRVPAKPAMLRIAAGLLGLALVASAGAGAVASASATELTAAPETTESALVPASEATPAADVPAAGEQAPAAPPATASSTPAPADDLATAAPPVEPTSVPAPVEVPTIVPTPDSTLQPTSAPPVAKILPQAQALAVAATPLTCQNGTVYTIDSDGTLLLVNTNTAAQTTIGDISSNNDLNALALTKDGQYAYAVRDTASNNGNMTVYRYTSATGVTNSFNGVQNLQEEDGTFVMGGINPATGFYYYGRVIDNRLELYGFNTTTNTSIGFVGSIAITTDSAGVARTNGDLVFSSEGIMYFVASSNTTASNSNALMRVSQQLPTAGSNATLTATLVSFLNINNQQKQFNGIAFDGGFLYLDTSGKDFYKVNPSTGAVISTSTLQNGAPVDMASCQYNNTLQVQKNIGARVVSTDQFKLTASVGTTEIGASGTTTGTSTGLQTGPGTFASSVPISGTTITIAETGPPGTALSQYTANWICKDQGDVTVASGTGTSGTFVFPQSTTSGVNVTCVITNQPLSAQVTVTKTWVNAVAGDKASFSANGNAAQGSSTALTNGNVITTTFPQGTTVNVAEVLASTNKGAYISALRCTNAAGTLVATGVLTGSFVLGASNVTCAYTNTNAAATVVVAKKWIVDGKAYDNGQQPQGISANLTLTGPGTAGASNQAWATVRSGYFAGNSVSINETTSFASPMKCTLKSSTLTPANATTTSVALPHVATLAAGANSYTITNTVDCITELTLLKFIDNRNGGSLVPGDFTLTAKPAGGTAWNVPGAMAVTDSNTESVTAGVNHTVSESSALKPAYLQLSMQRYAGTLNADGSLANPNAWVDADPTTVSVATGHHGVYRFVNASAPALTLPLTGGTGTSAYMLAGGGLLLLAIFTTGWIVFRRIKAHRP
ncbi:LPXTG cell wall anchor domain-containing protein [Arthrobacter glacialis]|nr:LPXTG cell wall anchor domain-containing protein [Arthrobacter glacialis]